MSETIALHDSCSRCGVAFHGSDNFCRNCDLPAVIPAGVVVAEEPIESRHPLATAPSHSTLATRPSDQLVSTVLESRAYVIAILLCIGPIGLPVLWLSRCFSRRFKIIATVGYFLVTVVLPLAIAWYFLDIAVRPVVDALGQ